MSDEKESAAEPTIKENPLRAEKRRKLNALRELGVNPYPHNFTQKNHAADLHAKYSHLNAGDKVEGSVTLAGRMMTMRDMGKAAFFNLQDQTGRIQFYLRIQELPESAQQAFKLVDIGDIVGVTGFVFKTQKGELSVHAQNFEMLCKTLEPLPEKYHGIADVETKYRLRHLDLIMNEDSRKVFIARSKIISEFRKFLDARGFLEVETPVLQPVYGGAAAHPFSTHHRALDMKLYMKISPEIYLKRLIVGGYEKVYEIATNFRNEGIDRSHNPEFRMLEFYEAYTDYNYQMTQFEELIAHVAKAVTGSTKVTYQGKEIEFAPPWRRLTVHEGIREYGQIDPDKISDGDLFKKLKEWGSPKDKAGSRGEMLMEAFELVAEKHLWQPTFVMDHPVEISPLTKSHRDKPGLVERFEPFAACMEIGNAYTELNDPEEQLSRLKEQEANRENNEESHPMDDDFIHAIEVGMPPTGGVGIGVERIVMILTDSPSIRDIIFFSNHEVKIAMGSLRNILSFLAFAIVLSACASKPTKVYTSQDVDNLFLEKSLNQPITLNNETILVDTRSDFDYAMIHAPNAIHVKWSDFVESPETGLLRKDLTAEAHKLALLGIGIDSRVVVIGYGPKGAGEDGRVAWFLVYLGIRNVQIAEMDGLGVRYSNIETPPRPNAADWEPNLISNLIVDRDEMVQVLSGKDTRAVHILDVRSKNEFFSKDRNFKYERPELGAVNIDWHEFFTNDGRPNPDMRKKLQAIGIERSHRIVVISNHGVRSGAVTYALTALGFHDVGNYVGGYLEILKKK